MYHSILSGAFRGMDSFSVYVEVDVSDGLPCMEMIGYLAGEVKESRERVRVGIKNSGYKIPPKRITVNLSPADIKKDGSAFDLAMALGILQCLERETEGNREEESGKQKIADMLVLGELGLDGKVKPVRGVLPILLMAEKEGTRYCIIPKANAAEAESIENICCFAVETLQEAYAIYGDYLVNGFFGEKWQNCIVERKTPAILMREAGERKEEVDFSQIYGQEQAKRAAEVAAAGFHNMLLFGPPGSGKTMIAERMRTIMPRMTYRECMDVTKVYSIAGLLNDKISLVTNRPYEQPHHSITPQALIGGGQIPRPGCVVRAHHGILFLDELPEFGREKLDLLRQPLEDKKVRIARNLYSCTYDADFMLMAAMNPCPCGYFPDLSKCRCKSSEIRAYLRRISGPLLDRIDISAEVGKIEWEQLYNCGDTQSSGRMDDIENRRNSERKNDKKNRQSSDWKDNMENGWNGGREKSNEKNKMGADKVQERTQGVAMAEPSSEIRKRVERTQEFQFIRQKKFNSELTNDEIKHYCLMEPEAEHILKQVYKAKELSVRSLMRIRKVARTIADMAECEIILQEHVVEAVMLNNGLETIVANLQ